MKLLCGSSSNNFIEEMPLISFVCDMVSIILARFKDEQSNSEGLLGRELRLLAEFKR